METQARYTIVGLFTLAIVVAGFVFVYWLHGFGAAGPLTHYRIRFEAPVIGLRPGVAVLFNGLHVGEVTAVGFDPALPQILLAEIAVVPSTPIRQDTRVGIDAPGLLGASTVSLRGGSSTTPLEPGPDGQPAMLVASAGATESLAVAARTALAQLDGILADNAKPLHEMIDNLSAFSTALGRNASRVDGIMAGIENLTGGGAPKPPPPSYTLSAAKLPAAPESADKAKSLQLAIAEPTAVVAYETQKLLVSPKPDELKPMLEGQWADSVPKLAQAKLVESFENAGFEHVSKATDGFTPEMQLLLEIRSFQVSTLAPAAAQVDISAKLLGADSKISAQHDFRASAPVSGDDSAAVAAALNAAFQTVAKDLVTWTEGAL